MGATTQQPDGHPTVQLFADRGYADGTGTDSERPGNNRGTAPRIRSFRDASDTGTDTPGTDADTPKRTRRPRTRRGDGAAADALGELIYEGLGALNGVLEVARGPHWKIPDGKVRRVGMAYGAVIDHYFPADKIGESSLIIGALIATAAAYGPPLMVDGMRAMEAAQKAAVMRAARATQTPPPYNPAGWAQPQAPRYESPFGAPSQPVMEAAQPFADAVTMTPEMWEQAASAMGFDPHDPMVRGAMDAAAAMMANMETPPSA